MYLVHLQFLWSLCVKAHGVGATCVYLIPCKIHLHCSFMIIMPARPADKRSKALSAQPLKTCNTKEHLVQELTQIFGQDSSTGIVDLPIRHIRDLPIRHRTNHIKDGCDLQCILLIGLDVPDPHSAQIGQDQEPFVIHVQYIIRKRSHSVEGKIQIIFRTECSDVFD